MPDKKTKTTAKVTLPGEKRARAVYVGPRGGKYVKKDGRFVSLASCMGGKNAKSGGGTTIEHVYTVKINHTPVPCCSDLSVGTTIPYTLNEPTKYECKSDNNCSSIRFFLGSYEGVARNVIDVRLVISPTLFFHNQWSEPEYTVDVNSNVNSIICTLSRDNIKIEIKNAQNEVLFDHTSQPALTTLGFIESSANDQSVLDAYNKLFD